jgi:hypothetical protein
MSMVEVGGKVGGTYWESWGRGVRWRNGGRRCMFPEKTSEREKGSSGFAGERRLRSCRRCCRLGKDFS